jgi:hypothetical protein
VRRFADDDGMGSPSSKAFAAGLFGALLVMSASSKATDDMGFMWRHDFARRARDAPEGRDDRLHGAVALADGGLALVGSRGDPARAWVVRSASDGHVIWDRLYGPEGGWSEANGIAATRDGGFVVVGDASRSPVWRSGEGWVFRLDADGGETWPPSSFVKPIAPGLGFNGAAFFNVALAAGGGIVVGGIADYKLMFDNDAASHGRYPPCVYAGLDASGKVLWDKSVAQSKGEYGRTLQQVVRGLSKRDTREIPTDEDLRALASSTSERPAIDYNYKELLPRGDLWTTLDLPRSTGGGSIAVLLSSEAGRTIWVVDYDASGRHGAPRQLADPTSWTKKPWHELIGFIRLADGREAIIGETDVSDDGLESFYANAKHRVAWVRIAPTR